MQFSLTNILKISILSKPITRSDANSNRRSEMLIMVELYIRTKLNIPPKTYTALSQLLLYLNILQRFLKSSTAITEEIFLHLLIFFILSSKQKLHR